MPQENGLVEETGRPVQDSGNGSAHASDSLLYLARALQTLDPYNRTLFLRSLSTGLLDRRAIAFHAGFDSYNGVRNLFSALGYKSTLDINDYRDMYRRGGIAKTLIDCNPDEMWSGGVSVIEQDSDPDKDTEFEAQVEELFNRLNVVSRFKKADKLAGLSTYSIILIGVKDKPNTDLSSSLPKLSGPDSVIFLQQYAEDQAKIIELERNTSDLRFGLPLYYQITAGTPSNNSNRGILTPTVIPKVHWTRVIHIAHDSLESDYIGTPDLESVWNLLTDLLKVTGGGAEAAWRKMDQGLHIDLDPEFEHKDEDVEVLRQQLEDYRHNLNRDIRTEGVKINPISSQVDKYGSNIDPIMDQIAGTKRIPKRKLLGSEVGSLASDQDRKNYADSIKSRKTEFGEPVLRQFIDRLIEFGGLAKPSTSGYQFDWYEEEELDETGKGNLTESIARANQAQAHAGDTVIMTSDEIRDHVWSLEPLPEPEIENKSSNETNPIAQIPPPNGGVEEDSQIPEDNSIAA